LKLISEWKGTGGKRGIGDSPSFFCFAFFEIITKINLENDTQETKWLAVVLYG
jgi:hypothetical protein